MTSGHLTSQLVKMTGRSQRRTLRMVEHGQRCRFISGKGCGMCHCAEVCRKPRCEKLHRGCLKPRPTTRAPDQTSGKVSSAA